MSLFQALILGLVQGLTEFFPISSSAHLKIAKTLLHIPDGEHLIFFDLCCHAGTLLALLLFLRREIWQIVTSVKQISLYALALIPLVPAYFLLKPLRMAASEPKYLGFALMTTALFLFLALRKIEIGAGKKWKNVLCIGLAQTVALIPGISRSGSTISAARLCGWSWKEAAQFSFLLSVPTIFGGSVLELAKAGVGTLSPACYAGGFCASFVLGLASVRVVFWIYERQIVRPFAWYCLIAGFCCYLWLN